MYDELGIGDLIDQMIYQDEDKRNVSLGQALKAMVLNGLGFANQPLYLMPHFFEDKPVERLLGKGIKAEYLNDDVMGRTLDKLYSYGINRIYTTAHCFHYQQMFEMLFKHLLETKSQFGSFSHSHK